ncbi:hypothetical protein PsAD2_00801 [Pseudovibrio axinellae]|uniref:Uncharacterized protein n=1 Tax=Pseudovibrio axinellae TaxID=989403 RepID=A0A161VBJ0_9HYPH|nr:hypothetical protein PsAD2_00801 [Pseudovibrio axinellae]SER07454.1 hypothetical protein SAMN05421798_10672 [Pseudovibrio axinellae]
MTGSKLPRRPYSVLLPVGFTMPFLLPKTRWALTPPFHPYQCMHWRYTLCGTFPKVTLAGRYPAPCFHGARTFLHCGLSALAAATVQPTGSHELRSLRKKVKQRITVAHALPTRPALCEGHPRSAHAAFHWPQKTQQPSPCEALPNNKQRAG